MDQVTWFCTKWDQVTWIRKIVDQVTWETKFEDQITSTTILQKRTRLPGRGQLGGGGAWRVGTRLVRWYAPHPGSWRERRGISDSMATTHMQNGTGQLESKLVEDQVPLRCPTVLPTCMPQSMPLPTR